MDFKYGACGLCEELNEKLQTQVMRYVTTKSMDAVNGVKDVLSEMKKNSTRPDVPGTCGDCTYKASALPDFANWSPALYDTVARMEEAALMAERLETAAVSE